MWKRNKRGGKLLPYCGAKTAEDMPKIQPGPETVSQAAYVSNDRETEEFPVYKRKNKAALIVAFVPLICAILNSFVLLGGTLLAGSKPNYTDISVISEAILILWEGM